MKQNILTMLVGAAAFSSNVQAKFDGLYIGANLEYVKQNTNLDTKENPGDTNSNSNKTRGGLGMPATECFFGLGNVFFERFYGGLEGQVDFLFSRKRNITETSSELFKAGRKGIGVTALIRLGYIMTPHTMIYLGVGTKCVRFTYDFIVKQTNVAPVSFDRRSFNLLTELGFETLIEPFKKLSLRCSYAVMPKEKLIRKTSDFPINHPYRLAGILKTGTAEHVVKVGMMYWF